MIERNIIKGLIASTEYLKMVKPIWDPNLIEAPEARRVAHWCWEYFDKYDKAPGMDFEGIFYSKLKEGKLPKELAEELQEELLPKLSDEIEKEGINVEYLFDETQKHFTDRNLEIHARTILAELSAGNRLDAENRASGFKGIVKSTETGLDFNSEVLMPRIERAFTLNNQTLIKYPNQLGQFWNSQLVRGAFVALMGTEKRGKTFWLLDMAIRACNQGQKVAFFQAGDMTEDQQLMRMCIYLAGRSNLPKYCAKHWIPVRDCKHNQLNNCDREDRACKFGVFDGRNEEYIENDIDLEELINAKTDNPDYVPCTNCKEYDVNHWGAVWIKEYEAVEPLKMEEAKQVMEKWVNETAGSLRLSTHMNDSLSVKQIKAILGLWEKQDNFIPDVIIVDYADLLVPESKEFRHGQNEIWKGLRAISQSKGNPLVITATQADARGYDQDRLRQKNFSEDKRKYAHVTAMWGLNQDKNGREKKLRLMVINEIVVREGEFSTQNEIKVLQDLWRGRPFIGSYF